MPSIRPFRGFVYNAKKVKNLSSVVAPPYDVISRNLQDSLYNRHPYNIVRLTLGKTKKRDDIKDNRYTRAKNFFDSWIKAQVLLQDKRPALYIYSQKYKIGARNVERLGFLGLMRLNTGKRKKVLPHENILLAPKLDRLNLIRSVRANLEPIFVLYEDKANAVSKIMKRFCSESEPFIDIYSNDVQHRIWRLEDERAIKRVGRIMRPKTIYIADGHHRYDVALTYSIEAQNKNLPRDLKRKSKFMMAYFVELNERVLTILPTHRLIKNIGILKKADVKKRLAKFFDIEKTTDVDALVSRLNALNDSHAFGLYLGNGKFFILKLKDTGVLDRLIKNNSRDWKRLDVTILHLFILEYVLGIRDDDDNVEFIKEPEEVLRLVDSGRYKLAFILNPTKVSQVKRIANLGERMPRKATYFYPKPLSGLVINKLY